jgi:hypothetical protein
MNALALRAAAYLLPAAVLLLWCTLTFRKEKTFGSVLQLVGAISLLLVEVFVNGRSTFLQQALAGPLALLLCGEADQWDSRQLDRLRERYGRVVSLRFLSASESDAALVDQGDASARLGVRDAAQHLVRPDAQHLVRPDGYIAFRCAGCGLQALEQYLAAWYASAASRT